MGLYSKGNRIVFGASMSKQSEFQSAADQALLGSPERERPWAMVRVEDNGSTRVFGFDNEDTAKGAFSAVSAQTPGSALVALYQRGELFDIAYRPPRIEHTETRKERAGIGWILGGVALGMLGLAIGTKHKS